MYEWRTGEVRPIFNLLKHNSVWRSHLSDGKIKLRKERTVALLDVRKQSSINLAAFWICAQAASCPKTVDDNHISMV